MKHSKKYLFTALVLLCSILASAQSGFFIPRSAKIFFIGDSATIFSNVINKGNLGIGENAFVNFTAASWENDPASNITDESLGGNGVTGTGGWLRFISDTIRQTIGGGYNTATKTGPTFSHLMIQNQLGVDLVQSNIKVRKEINLKKGLVYLHDQIFVVGDNNPGSISGYDSMRYFVTANQASSGILLRENMRRSDGKIIFPVGSKANSYTPAAIESRSRSGDDYFVNVFDGVRSSLFSGSDLADESVQKTWMVGREWRPGNDDIEVTLQHNNNEEGSLFKQNKQYSYISKYNINAWDTAYPQSFPGPGILTSGQTLLNSGTNSRVFYSGLSVTSYFTKLTGAPAKKTNLWFNAYRLDQKKVYTYWKTNPEINVKNFYVQRMLSNETNFQTVGVVASQANSGYSSVLLNYSFTDENDYTGISFYRLMVLSYTNDTTYSDTVAVGNKPGLYSIMLWPNPTPDVFFVSIHKPLPVKAILITNVLGQKLREEPVNGRTIIQMSGLRPGTYFVSIVLTTGYIIETKKLIVR